MGISVWGLSGYNTKNLTVNHRRWRVWKYPGTLKNSLVDFERELDQCSRDRYLNFFELIEFCGVILRSLFVF